MDVATDLGRAPEANVLNALDFEKALVHVLHWLRQEQHTFIQYLHHQPTNYEPVVTTLRGIITSVPPATPAASPRADDEPIKAPRPRSSSQAPHNEGEEGTPICDPGDSTSPPSSPQDQEIETDRRRGGSSNARLLSSQGVCASEARHKAKLSPIATDAVYTMQQKQDAGGQILLKCDGKNRHNEWNESITSYSQEDLRPSLALHPSESPEVSKRELQASFSNDLRTSKRRRLSRKDPEADFLPTDVACRVREIAAFDDLVFLWEQLKLLSESPHVDLSISREVYRSNPCLQTLSRRERLETLWVCISNHEKLERWATILQRLCQVEFFGQYLYERRNFNQCKEQRRRSQASHRVLEVTPIPTHPLREYVDLCIPIEMERNRSKAKKKFENMVQTKEPWVKLAQRYVSERLKKSHFESFLNLIEASKPALSDQLNYLSEFLSFFVEHGRLPPYKLRLEMLSKDQLESLRSTAWSLRELLDRGECRDAERSVPNSPRLIGSTNKLSKKDDSSMSLILSPASSVFSLPRSSRFLGLLAPSFFPVTDAPSYIGAKCYEVHDIPCGHEVKQLPNDPLCDIERTWSKFE